MALAPLEDSSLSPFMSESNMRATERKRLISRAIGLANRRIAVGFCKVQRLGDLQ